MPDDHHVIISHVTLRVTCVAPPGMMQCCMPVMHAIIIMVAALLIMIAIHVITGNHLFTAVTFTAVSLSFTAIKLSNHRTTAILILLLLQAIPAYATDPTDLPTDLPSFSDLHDTLIGMIHHHGIAHVMTAIAAALPIATNLPGAFDNNLYPKYNHTAILGAIATIAAFAATITYHTRDESHDPNDDTPDWLIDAADVLEHTSTHSSDDEHVTLQPRDSHDDMMTIKRHTRHRGVALDDDDQNDDDHMLSLNVSISTPDYVTDSPHAITTDGKTTDHMIDESNRVTTDNHATDYCADHRGDISGDRDDPDCDNHSDQPKYGMVITSDDSIALQARMATDLSTDPSTNHVDHVIALQARARAANTIAIYWLLMNEERYESMLEDRNETPYEFPPSESESPTIRNLRRHYISYSHSYARHRARSRVHDW